MDLIFFFFNVFYDIFSKYREGKHFKESDESALKCDFTVKNFQFFGWFFCLQTRKVS